MNTPNGSSTPAAGISTAQAPRSHSTTGSVTGAVGTTASVVLVVDGTGVVFIVAGAMLSEPSDLLPRLRKIDFSVFFICVSAPRNAAIAIEESQLCRQTRRVTQSFAMVV